MEKINQVIRGNVRKAFYQAAVGQGYIQSICCDLYSAAMVSWAWEVLFSLSLIEPFMDKVPDGHDVRSGLLKNRLDKTKNPGLRIWD